MAQTYDYCFDLDPGEAIRIGENTQVRHHGFSQYGEQKQLRVGIDAPLDISILRLEVFARQMQSYEYQTELRYGQRLRIGDKIELVFLPDKFGYKAVQIEIKTAAPVRKSIKNSTDNAVQMEI